MIILRFRTALENGRLKVVAPSWKCLESVRTSATSLGDSFFLSETDKQVLALALEAKMRGDDPQIATDDYSIQNVAKQLGLQYVSMATFGIKRMLTWVRYCPACHRQYPANFKAAECPICGTKLKRKPVKSAPKAAKERM